ncbi:phosphatidylcholine-hydrolyzing phospholipase c [Naviculisporaceae sp. PSN 640]
MSAAAEVLLTKDILGHEPTGWDYDHTNTDDSTIPANVDFEALANEAHSHHDTAHLVDIPVSDKEIEAATKIDYVNWMAEEKAKRATVKDGDSSFEFAEHASLGDALTLQWHDGQSYVAKNKPFTLANGLEVTYGQINGLAGDFYGTTKPISDPKDLQDQRSRFLRAFYWLAEDRTRNPKEAQTILGLLSTEVDKVSKAVADGQDPSEVYHTLPDLNFQFQALTIDRPAECPSYLVLASINWDHFGEDARTAYNAGHSVALQTAASGNLELAYAQNAFADHFLQDSFAAGHMRTPRRKIVEQAWGEVNRIAANLCAKYMHDEENAIGLSVRNPAGRSWTTYGDKRLLDKADIANKNEAWNAVRTSADEIFEAWKTGKVPAYPNYGAWNWAPILSEVQQDNQVLAPLFTRDGKRRDNLGKRCEKKYTNWYTYAKTVADIQVNGLWNYPIQLTGDCKK